MAGLVTPKKKNDRGQNIQVFVRVRPLNSLEKSMRSCSVIDTPGHREVVVKEKQTSSLTKTFNFDRVFGPNSKQNDVYKSVVGPLIGQVMQGYNCTVFAYGQTGTGKTYTMEGQSGRNVPIDQDPDAGIIPRALNALFDGLRLAKDATEWSVRVSFLELYNEEIFDLLSGSDDHSKLRLYEDGIRKGSVIIQGLEEVQVHDKQEVYRIIERGSEKRRTAETKMNANSSRSHTVFTVTVFINQQSIDGDDMLKIGKLNLVDLAGSENIGRSGAVDKRAREAGNINQSLLTLGRVITCLVDRAPHVPYRESKLTRLLQDSLGGRTKTSIIATVSPALINLEETLSTLDYAHRAKNITNKPEVNQKISKKEKLLEYHAEIDKLKSELQAARDKDGVFLPKETYDEQIKQKERDSQEIKEKTLQLKAMEEEMEKFQQIIAETTARLEETTAQRDKTQRALDCTRTVLHKTESERAEEAHLVARHVDTECKLSQQAQLLLTVSDEATKDLEKVHDKLDRKRRVEQANEETLETFRSGQSERHSKLEGLIGHHFDVQSDFCGRQRNKIDDDAGRRAEERSQLASDYADTVSKLIQTMGDIERVTSDQMYSEQSWVEQLLKRVRNEADSATNDFHKYLVDQLFTVSTKILAALQKQDKTVQELSAKMDKSFAGINDRLEQYLSEQAKIRDDKRRLESEFFAGLERRNNALSMSFQSDVESTQEYVKKSNAFTEQMMSLIQARAKEEKAFLSNRNTTVNNAMELISATSEAGQSANKAAQEGVNLANGLDSGLKDDQVSALIWIKAEKAEAMEEINQAGQEAAKATSQLRSDAESFAQSAKDQWVNHYSRTESSLREKSDKSSAHVSSVQEMTGRARKALQKGQTSAENAIETWRQADEKATRDAHEAMAAQCSDLAEFGPRLRDEIRAAEHASSSLVNQQMKRDIVTGSTPVRVVREFPNEIVAGTPDDIRRTRFRTKWNASGLATKINMDIADSELHQELDESESNVEDNHSTSRDSVFSGSVPLSRQNSGGNLSNVPTLKPSKTSNTNLSEASTDAGIVGDLDNKENADQFNRPRGISRIKQPGYISQRTRSGSRTRQKLESQVD